MHAKVLRWGNSYGIRIAKADAEREGLRVGQEIVIEILARPGQRVDLSSLRAYPLGGDLAARHDEVERA